MWRSTHTRWLILDPSLLLQAREKGYAKEQDSSKTDTTKHTALITSVVVTSPLAGCSTGKCRFFHRTIAEWNNPPRNDGVPGLLQVLDCRLRILPDISLSVLHYVTCNRICPIFPTSAYYPTPTFPHPRYLQNRAIFAN